MAILAILIANVINSALIYRNARSVYQTQFLKFKKLENELHPLPRAFSLKLVTSLIATPDEIAEALLNPDKRKLWDLNVEIISAQKNNILDVQYTTSGSRYQLSHTLLTHNNQYLIHELIKINGGQTKAFRLFAIEEVDNRPYLVRLTLYISSITESEARQQIKNLNSIGSFITSEDRPQ